MRSGRSSRALKAPSWASTCAAPSAVTSRARRRATKGCCCIGHAATTLAREASSCTQSITCATIDEPSRKAAGSREAMFLAAILTCESEVVVR